MTKIRTKEKKIYTAREKRELKKAMLFISPWIIGFIVFTAYPIISSLYFSFCDYNVIASPKWAGFKNYTGLFKDQIFITACKNTLYMMLIGVPLTTLAAVSVSLLLNYKKLKGTGWMRVVFFIPTLVPTVVGCLLWIWVMQPDSGVLNSLLGCFGIKGPGWLSDPVWAKPAFLLFMIWTCGNAVIIYLAGLQEVPASLYDAASVDGAGFFKQALYITLPTIRPTILYNVVILTIGVFQWFTEPYIMTSGGPAYSTMFYSLYLYNNAFQYFRMGYASAQAYVMLIIVMLLVMVLFKVFRFDENAAD